MEVTIDSNSGYCFGVEYAIQMAEDELKESGSLYCLGDIVHNGKEVDRLEAMGLKIIDRKQLEDIHDAKVLIRAHGEPPSTYELALRNNIELIDASCPVVLKLQNRVKSSYDTSKREDGQIVIYGKPGHAEVIGLTGQTHNEAIIVKEEEDLEKIDFSKPITLYSQTTKSTKGFYKLKEQIEERVADKSFFKANDSICRQVSNREPQLLTFAQENDVILFVAGKKSSNGKALFQVCKSVNPRSYFLEGKEDLKTEWITTAERVGICGATSTPMWLMEELAAAIEDLAVEN